MTKRILFATSELFPLLKTGGLADVSYSLPLALSKMGLDVTLMMPGYRSVRQKLGPADAVYSCLNTNLRSDVTIERYCLPETNMPLLLVSSPSLFDRDGGPYVDAYGQDWFDNADRFTQFCRAVVAFIEGAFEYDADFDAVHCNDWQTGLIPAFLKEANNPIVSVFTIHNIAYQGVFDRSVFDYLNLPKYWWHYERLEFYGDFSFLKAGIVYSDRVTTVSPTYAKEILVEPAANGLAGLLKFHQSKLVGILNGADYDVWNPRIDPYLVFPYDEKSLDEKLHNKLDLQRQIGFKLLKTSLMVGMVSRLVDQKGVDWVIDAIESLRLEKIQWVILGSGDSRYEQALLMLQAKYPDKVFVTIGYNESLAHKIEASSDAFVMPSRFEPCGLNQIYSLKYGTLPIVRATGGLVDTVVDATDANIQKGCATGLVFNNPSSVALIETLQRALLLYRKKKAWRQVQVVAMQQDFGWIKSAGIYASLYLAN